MALSGRQEAAAGLVASGVVNLEEIAERVGCARKTVFNWRQSDEFAARVEEIREQIREKATVTGIALVTNRVARLNDTWERMKLVVKERSEDETMHHVPGGRTGLLVRTTKFVRVIGEWEPEPVDHELEGQPHGGALKRNRKQGEDGKRSIEVQEFAVDTGLLKELREHERQASQELGQWLQKTETTHKGAVTIRTITAVQPALSAASEASE